MNSFIIIDLFYVLHCTDKKYCKKVEGSGSVNKTVVFNLMKIAWWEMWKETYLKVKPEKLNSGESFVQKTVQDTHFPFHWPEPCDALANGISK